jgi:hypothetical protein
MVRIQLKFIDDAVVLVNAFQKRVVNDGGVFEAFDCCTSILESLGINGGTGGYLDVKDSTAFPLNFSIGDIRDISKRTGSFSKTITLVGNSNNNNLLNHYYDVNIQAGTFDINQLTSCDVIQDGIPVMINATLQLISIKKSQLTSAYEQIVEYEVLVKENRGTFFTDISNKYLTDLDFSDLDHYIDPAEVINSFDHTVNNGYKYVMPFNIDNQYQFNWFKPAIYAQTYFDRIFATSGYSYTWAGLEDANFDKLLIPYNGDQNIVDWNDYKVVAENSGNTITIAQNNATTLFIRQITSNANITTGWTELSDPGNIFNPSTGEYTTPQWVGLNSGESYIYEATVQGTIKLNVTHKCITDGGFYFNGTFFRYRPYLLVKVGNTKNVKCYGQNADLSIGTVYEVGLDTILTFNQIFTFNASIGQIFPPQGIDVNDIQIVMAGVELSVVFNDGSVVLYDDLVWRRFAASGSWSPPQIILDIAAIDLTIRPSDNIPLNSGITTMNTFVPEKIKQSDYIKSIFMMYNLYATSDPDNENNLILLHRDEYYDSGKAVDWTNKLMKDKEQSIIFIPELNNKKLRLTYKADTDSPNTVYTDVTKEVYGQAEVTFENEYVKGIDVKELIFSPTPVQPTSFGAFLPLLNGASPKTNIRILYDNGQLTAQDVNILSGYDTVTATGGKYPYLSHFGGASPFNPEFDINFAPCQYYYYQVAQNTNNNLYNSYWRRTVAQINGGKLLTAYFLLNEVDIQLMELNDKIRIDNSWWSINKVIDYNANYLQPTKVELISLETEIDLPTFFGGTILPVGPGKGDQTVSILDGYNNETNVTTDNKNAIIIGSGNVVGDGLRALVVGDGLTVENNGIATTNLTVTNTINGRAVSEMLPTYTKYVALITQSGTNDPTVIELENSIGPIVWTRTAVGNYEGTLAGAFTLNKTYSTLSQVATNSIALVYAKNVNTILIQTTNLHSPIAAHHDSHLSNNTIEIRVYE